MRDGLRRGCAATLFVVLWSAMAVVAAVAAPVQRLTQYGHTAWRTQDGQISAESTAVQGKDGYLWIATDAGLVRFDGMRFTPYNTFDNGSIADWKLTGIYAAADGALWIGGSGYVARLKDGHITRFATEGRLAAFAEDSHGVLWFIKTRVNGRGGPLCNVVAEAIRCIGPPELPIVNAVTLLPTAAGLWVGDASTLCLWTPGQAATCHHLAALEAFVGLRGITAIVERKDGALWVGVVRTGPGLGLLKLEHGAWTSVAAPDFDGTTVAVASLLEDREGSLWIGTVDRGLYHLNDDHVDHYGSAEGLTSNTIRGGIVEDRDGTVWVSTSAGMDAFRRVPVSAFSVREGLPADAASAVLPARDGTTWISSLRLATLRDDRVVPLPTAVPFAGQAPTALLEDHAGRMWIGLRDTLNIVEHGASRPVTTRDGRSPGTVRSLVEDAAHDVWITTLGEHAGMFRIRDGVAEPRLAGQAMGKPWTIAAAPAGGLWLATRGGALAHYDGETVTTSIADDSGSPPITAMAVDDDGTVLGVTAQGLLIQRRALRRMLGAEQGLPCGGLTAVVRDRGRALWLMARCGLVRIDGDALERWIVDPAAAIPWHVLDRTDGARPGLASFTPAAKVGPDGRLWFASDDVAQVVDPARLPAQVPVPVVVEDIVADRNALPARAALTLPADTRDLEIRYTALALGAAPAVRFQYLLEGRDRGWQDAGTRRQAFYTDLRPGRYRFRVRGALQDGAWNEAARPAAFDIPPRFYQTWWFIALCVAGAIASLYAWHLVRIRRVAATIHDRQAVKNAERERIARDLHDTLLQSTQGMILLIQQATRRMPLDEPARPLMEKALDRADATLRESRDRVKELRGDDEPVDVVRAIDAAIDAVAWPGVSGRPSFEVRGDVRPLHAEVASELVAIAREALVNAVRHAHATRIDARLVFGASALDLAVRDDGTGIAEHVREAGRADHWGLLGMRERATKIGATLHIGPGPGGGTSVVLSVPARRAYARLRATRWRWRW